ncbi:MAG: hypothetical protein R8N24_02270 [Alphaproteobacteria bacterium]|nr:hypothetical protein [Alphaproteobacteria bacterium]
MRLITISMLSLCIVLPAGANARLPVVNIASGGVSARAAFGAQQPVQTQKIAKTTAPTRVKKVVARSAKVAPAAQPKVADSVSVASNDVLMPMRPSADLWARNNDVALRMPRSDEFSVIRSDNLLPEENIDSHIVMQSEQISPDAEVEMKLAELQKRANDSVRTIAARDADMPVLASADNTDISVKKLIVPMEQDSDVVVRRVEKNVSPRIASVRDDMTKMSPAQLRQAFRKTFLSENKHLSTFSIDDKFDVASDMTSSTGDFVSRPDLSEQNSGIRTLEIKIKFRDEDSSLSRANYTLLTEYAGIVVNKPTRAVQIAIPQYMTMDADERKLAARRLAIVEQVLTDNGVSKQRIVPVLSQREEPGFVLRMISSDQYDTLTQQSRNIFGDTVSKKTYKSMSW